MSCLYYRFILANQKCIKRGSEWLARYFWGLDENRQLWHHGIKGQKWGVRNGPPYPIDRAAGRSTIVREAIESGAVSKRINREKQLRHTKDEHLPGRSYIDGDLEYAQELVDKLSGTGEARIDHYGNWNHRERVVSPHIIGTYVDENGTEIESNMGMIVYSKTGTHIYPVRRKDENIQ